METAPSTMRTTPGMYVPMPPTFCSHFPVPAPTMFMNTASHRQMSVAVSTYVQSLAIGLSPLPTTNVAITAVDMSRLG